MILVDRDTECWERDVVLLRMVGLVACFARRFVLGVAEFVG